MDKQSAAFLYKKYSRMVENVGQHGTRSREAAEDIRQQVFINVFQSLESFRSECELKTWIFRIALNECHHHRLRNWRENRKVTAYLENPPETKDEVSDWDDRILVQRLLELADSENHKAMEMMFTQDMTQAQTAKALGVSRVTVAKRLDKFRAVAKAVIRLGR